METSRFGSVYHKDNWVHKNSGLGRLVRGFIEAFIPSTTQDFWACKIILQLTNISGIVGDLLH